MTRRAIAKHADQDASLSRGALGFSFGGNALEARPSCALWLADQRLLCVADLHLGKSERTARRGGPFLPPYDTMETLDRLRDEIEACAPETVLCLGDSFDDPRAAAALTEEDIAALRILQAGRRWIWVAGNHDPIRDDALSARLGGEFADEHGAAGLVFRHIAAPASSAFEVSGHYHPKATLFVRGRRLSRRCFLLDERRLILPAFGAYTGGLDAADPAFDPLLGGGATAFLLGEKVRAFPRRLLVAPHALSREPVDARMKRRT